MKAEDILRTTNMSSRPGYYSGRGATLTDLTHEHLEKIWGLIKKHHGDEAAKSFVSMVEHMKEMSATSFINELYSLQDRGWKFEQVAGHGGMDFDKDKDGNYNEAQIMGGMLSAMFSTGRDDTPAIRNRFLRSHGVNTKDHFSEDGYIYSSY